MPRDRMSTGALYVHEPMTRGKVVLDTTYGPIDSPQTRSVPRLPALIEAAQAWPMGRLGRRGSRPGGRMLAERMTSSFGLKNAHSPAAISSRSQGSFDRLSSCVCDVCVCVRARRTQKRTRPCVRGAPRNARARYVCLCLCPCLCPCVCVSVCICARARVYWVANHRLPIGCLLLLVGCPNLRR
jgi:hypothetical protein